jgi:hypothetical protein
MIFACTKHFHGDNRRYQQQTFAQTFRRLAPTNVSFVTEDLEDLFFRHKNHRKPPKCAIFVTCHVVKTRLSADDKAGAVQYTAFQAFSVRNSRFRVARQRADTCERQ